MLDDVARICVFGDSIAWGAWDDDSGGWVERLKADAFKLTVSGEADLRLYNNSVSGDRVADVLRRLDAEAAARSANHIVLAVGINDSYHHGPGTAPELFGVQYSALIDAAYHHTARITIIGPTNVDESLLPHWSNESIAIYSSLIAEAAERHGLTFTNPFGLLNTEDLMPDGLHPSPSGHAKLAKLIRPYLF